MASAFLEKERAAAAKEKSASLSSISSGTFSLSPRVENQGSIFSGTPRKSSELLSQIQEGRTLRKTEDATEGPSETFARAGLLNQITKGAELKTVSPPKSQGNKTMARAGLLNELQRKREATPAAAEGAGKVSESIKKDVKEGWLHKRATNGIWQKRYFVLASDALSYHTRPQTNLRQVNSTVRHPLPPDSRPTQAAQP